MRRNNALMLVTLCIVVVLCADIVSACTVRRDAFGDYVDWVVVCAGRDVNTFSSESDARAYAAEQDTPPPTPTGDGEPRDAPRQPRRPRTPAAEPEPEPEEEMGVGTSGSHVATAYASSGWDCTGTACVCRTSSCTTGNGDTYHSGQSIDDRGIDPASVDYSRPAAPPTSDTPPDTPPEETGGGGGGSTDVPNPFDTETNPLPERGSATPTPESGALSSPFAEEASNTITLPDGARAEWVPGEGTEGHYVIYNSDGENTGIRVIEDQDGHLIYVSDDGNGAIFSSLDPEIDQALQEGIPDARQQSRSGLGGFEVQSGPDEAARQSLEGRPSWGDMPSSIGYGGVTYYRSQGSRDHWVMDSSSSCPGCSVSYNPKDGSMVYTSRRFGGSTVVNRGDAAYNDDLAAAMQTGDAPESAEGMDIQYGGTAADPGEQRADTHSDEGTGPDHAAVVVRPGDKPAEEGAEPSESGPRRSGWDGATSMWEGEGAQYLFEQVDAAGGWVNWLGGGPMTSSFASLGRKFGWTWSDNTPDVMGRVFAVDSIAARACDYKITEGSHGAFLTSPSGQTYAHAEAERYENDVCFDLDPCPFEDEEGNTAYYTYRISAEIVAAEAPIYLDLYLAGNDVNSVEEDEYWPLFPEPDYLELEQGSRLSLTGVNMVMLENVTEFTYMCMRIINDEEVADATDHVFDPDEDNPICTVIVGDGDTVRAEQIFEDVAGEWDPYDDIYTTETDEDGTVRPDIPTTVGDGTAVEDTYGQSISGSDADLYASEQEGT